MNAGARPDVKVKGEGSIAPSELATAAESASPVEITSGLPGLALAPGDVLAGRYRVSAFLARGGMGEVYAAEDLELRSRVAVKTMRPQVAADPEALRRFKREALLARSVSHPSICRVYDVRRHGDLLFLTMELLDGETLRERIQKSGWLSASDALPIARQMAEGLEAAHRCGIVHRDFKSANVMLASGRRGERAVVTDFGLAAAAAGEGSGSAESSRAGWTGTLAYMAPEQLRGERSGPAADLYALGVVLFEMVTGRLPFTGKTQLAATLRRLTEEPPSPGTLVDLEPRWEATILRLLAPDPADRFSSAHEVVRALEGRPAREAARIRHTLPAESDAFVGREAELADLAGLLRSGARCVTILGAGGSGKTRLVRRLGWTTLDEWPGGVWFCDLSEARSDDAVLAAVANGLRVPLGRNDPVLQLGHAIAGRGRALIVLDNCEQVIEPARAIVGRWVTRAEDAAFLVTSRERLALPLEQILLLEPLPIEGAGIDLFELRAWAQLPEFTLTDSNGEAVREVVRLLDGIPLAIELAAAQVRTLTPEQIRIRLADRFRLLVATSAAPSRSSTLRASIDGSWELLPEWEKAALAQASVFEGGFTLDAAEAVLDLSAWPDAPAILDVIQALVDKSLVRIAPRVREDEPRLVMYLSVAAYAAEMLGTEGTVKGNGSGPDAKHAAEERHGLHFARQGTEEAIDGLVGTAGAVRRNALARDLENLVAACHRALVRGDGETVARAYRAAWHVLHLQGPFAEGVRLGLDILQRLDVLSPAERRAVLFTCGEACWLSGRMEEARGYLEQALAIARVMGDQQAEGRILNNLGNVHQDQGRIEESRALYEHALAAARAVGDRLAEGIDRSSLGILHLEQGRLEMARAHFEQALATHVKTGNRSNEGRVLCNLGALHFLQGDLDEAWSHYQRALVICHEVGDRRLEAMILGNLGNVRDPQEPEEASAYYQRALAIHREVGNRRSEGIILGNLADMHLNQDRWEQAGACTRQALAVSREVGDRFMEGVVLGTLGQLRAAEGRLADAREALAGGETILRDLRASVELGKLLCSRSEVERLDGHAGAAQATLAEVEALADSAGALPTSELRGRLAKARSALASGG